MNQDALDRLIKSLQPDAIYLFGSRASDKARASSDYDIAVLCQPSSIPPIDRQFDLRGELEQILSAEVDLVVLNEVGPIIAMQAVSKGKLLYEGSRKRHQDFLARLYSSYAEFKELRAPMEKNILKRKFYDR